mmetsp:Transcript_11133/g.68565  ORF Transcript_11133/g.68565 Transcript_11133/m.68565 type:complete len:150 (+) Transcript_11133:1160-1609(+)
MNADESESNLDMQPIDWGKMRRIMCESGDGEDKARLDLPPTKPSCQKAGAWQCTDAPYGPSNAPQDAYQRTPAATEMKHKGTQTNATVLQMVMRDSEALRYIQKISADGVEYALKQTKHLSTTFQAAMSAFDAMLEEEENSENCTESTQ